ncbi:MAG: hypothetical protein MZU79_00725 [Anaerotruncus sp.]|nr:hypothetical protein [Anaerotruncus sp.]
MRRVEGRRHLAGPEDRLSGGCDPCAAAVRPADRRVVRVLGGRGDAHPAGRRLRVRVAGPARAAGDADEDDRRRRAGRRAALGSRADGRRAHPGRDAVRGVRAGVRHRGLPAAGVDGGALRRRLRAEPCAERGAGGAEGHRRPGRAGRLWAWWPGEGLAGVVVAALVASGGGAAVHDAASGRPGRERDGLAGDPGDVRLPLAGRARSARRTDQPRQPERGMMGS